MRITENFRSIAEYPHGGKLYSNKDQGGRLVADASIMAGRHAFHAAHPVTSLVLSNAPMAVTKASKIKGFEMEPIDEVEPMQPSLCRRKTVVVASSRDPAGAVNRGAGCTAHRMHGCAIADSALRDGSGGRADGMAD